MASLERAFTGGVGVAIILSVILSVVTLALGALFVWNNAPPVGGEYWFYIRIAVTIVGAVIAAKVGAIIGYIVGGIAGGVIGGLLG